jgi:2-iminobutanoate/2-iminopropanoate deaminase
MEINPARYQISADPDWYEPYAISLGIRVGNLVFVSGQAAVDEHGDTVGGADFDAQARQAFANLATVLRNAGSGLEHVVKVHEYSAPQWGPGLAAKTTDMQVSNVELS